ncbi:MarR family winged helix-turn-helix transcriptional regulator [Actinokineospora fastidiosa]|uniref:HTH marR-type domain-containing protein n=1 Tax=Actinokineospora fastidiosa TaxID=1816 RepID=A0A918L6S9_9PSEU|nr:MarR family transcriptional regulator [Actinokineospora fastidiosa]GGS13099.1 hypothetical protein GCM10010171_01040 [Actinokineospora fastidiosa]
MTTAQPLGYWIKRVDRALDSAFTDAGLDRRAWQVLNTLSRAPAPIADLDRVLAPFLTADDPTTRPHVDHLAARGWARITLDTATLTPEGHQAHQRLAEHVEAIRSRVVDCLAPEEHALLLRLLQRVAARIDP